MFIKLSTKDMNFIRPLFTYLKLFQLVPWYDFDKNCIPHPNLSKLYSIALIILQVVTLIGDKSFYKLQESFFFSQRLILTGLYTTVFLLIILTIIKSSFWDEENFRKIITNLQFIDSKLLNNGSTGGRFYLNFLIKHLAFFLLGIYVLSVWCEMLNVPLWKMIVYCGFINVYREFLLTFLLYAFVECFKVRYEEINAKLVKIEKKEKFIEEVTNLCQYYRLLGETLDVFNSTFGYQIVLIIFFNGFQMIDSLNLSILLLSNKEFFNGDFRFLIVNVGQSVWITVSLNNNYQKFNLF